MKHINFKKILPHLVAIVVFLILSIIMTKPALEGKVVQQHDVQQAKAMAHQSYEFEKKNGYVPYWINSMFCGMPGYQIAMASKSGYFVSVGSFHSLFTLGLPKPVFFLFIACCCFYLLALVLGINPWLAILGGIAYGYSSYDPILIVAGHDTKLLSMAYAPAVLASTFLIFNKKYWLGSVLLLIFSTCLIEQSHQQILYYTLLTVGFAVIFLIIKTVKQKEYKHLLLSLGLNIFLPVVALLICSVGYLATYDYAQESMRGGASELTSPDKANKSKGGLDKDYAFNWSYGKAETFTLLVPNAMGGGGSTSFGDESKVLEVLQQDPNLPQQMAQQLYQAATPYWGEQPSTSGPVYFGAIICLLFLFGLFASKTEHKWWILAISIFAILLAWGKNFGAFNGFVFDNLPFYNKFRTPSMALVIPQLTFPLLAMLFLNELVLQTDKTLLAAIAKKCLVITGVTIAMMAAFYFMADFRNDATNELKKNLADAMKDNQDFTKSYISAIVKDRQALYLSDMWRSLGFIAVAIVTIFLYTRNLIKAPVLYASLILFTTIDLVSVGKRYLTFDNFVEPADYEMAYADYDADIMIKRDPGFFRVMNIAFQNPGSGEFQSSLGNAFNDAIASYKHNTIGGYHPAKLALFEDLKQNQLYRNFEAWGNNPNEKDSFQVLNMLNMKYVIVPDQRNPKQTTAITNPYALGNCWLVKDIKYVKNADEEMKSLNNFDPASTVIIDERYKKLIPSTPVYDSASYIRFIENKNDYIKYEFNATTNQFAVFSEMYYSRGWNAYIDGKKVDHVRVNYALRGLAIPAGKHSIEFKFEPAVVMLSEKLAKIASIFSVLFVLLSAFMIWKNNRSKPV